MDKERTGMLLLSKEDIKSVITMKDMIEADKQAFKMVVDGTVDTPLRTVINGKYDGAFLFMPAYAPELDAAAMKVINIFPHNIDNNLMTSPAQTMLIDGKTGYVIAMLDGTYVTQLRTGASSGAAFDLLGKKECKKGAMIGTGGQAATQLEAMLATRKLEEVKIFDLNEERCKAFAEEMQKELAKYGATIIPAKDSDDCIEDADLIITVTPSAKPVFDGTKVKAGATISCVGTYEPHKHELDPAVLPRASKIICDSKEAAQLRSKQYRLTNQSGFRNAFPLLSGSFLFLQSFHQTYHKGRRLQDTSRPDADARLLQTSFLQLIPSN